MSLFIVIDSRQQKYICKLIDLVSFEPIPEELIEQRDQGLIKGMLSILRLLDNILEGDEWFNWFIALSYVKSHIYILTITIICPYLLYQSQVSLGTTCHDVRPSGSLQLSLHNARKRQRNRFRMRSLLSPLPLDLGMSRFMPGLLRAPGPGVGMLFYPALGGASRLIQTEISSKIWRITQTCYSATSLHLGGHTSLAT